MFESISLKGLGKSARFGYAAKLPFFAKKKELEFKPGLNILFGPNGCGKSTVLRILSDTMFATQGGTSVVTSSALRDAVDLIGRSEPADEIGLSVAHDGQPVVFCDPRNSVGLADGAFDDDFMDLGLRNLFAQKEASHGQLSAHRIDKTLAVLTGKEKAPSAVEWRVSRKNVNTHWAAAFDIVEARMKASIERGQPTIILDEPEANFSLLWQSRLWDLISSPEVTRDYQVIVATHSVFALGIPDANYIDFEPGYVEKSTHALQLKALTLGTTRVKTGRTSSAQPQTSNSPKCARPSRKSAATAPK